MSDLAPFVAAAIRDKVVLDQQEEIVGLQRTVARLSYRQEELEKKLKERNPIRAIQIRGVRGEEVVLHTEGEVDLRHIYGRVSIPFIQEGEPDLCLTLNEFLDCVLVIDESPLVPFRQWRFTTKRYFRCTFTEEDFCYFRMDLNNDINLHAYLGPITANEYATLVNVDVNRFVPIRMNNGDNAHDGLERSIAHDLLVLFGNMQVKVIFDEGTCTGNASFLLNNLIPYNHDL
jgi:hypothetical protein